MAQNAYIDDLPLDLELDLLVDGELPEGRRRALLAALDGPPEQWRRLALRFLQHQTEKQSVAALMAGGSVVPVADVSPAVAARRPILGRIGWRRITAVAAGLLIAASSALVTLLAVRPATTRPLAEFQTTLPAEVVAANEPVRVSIPVMAPGGNPDVFQLNPVDNGPGRSTILVQPDGRDGYVVIPVNTSLARVY